MGIVDMSIGNSGQQCSQLMTSTEIGTPTATRNVFRLRRQARGHRQGCPDPLPGASRPLLVRSPLVCFWGAARLEPKGSKQHSQPKFPNILAVSDFQDLGKSQELAKRSTNVVYNLLPEIVARLPEHVAEQGVEGGATGRVQYIMQFVEKAWRRAKEREEDWKAVSCPPCPSNLVSWKVT